MSKRIGELNGKERLSAAVLGILRRVSERSAEDFPLEDNQVNAIKIVAKSIEDQLEVLRAADACNKRRVNPRNVHILRVLSGIEYSTPHTLERVGKIFGNSDPIPPAKVAEIEENTIKELRDIVFSSLAPREKEVLIARIGFENDGPKSCDELAKKYRIQPERVGYIERRALWKLMCSNLVQRSAKVTSEVRRSMPSFNNRRPNRGFLNIVRRN